MIDAELQLKDLDSVDKKILKIAKLAKSGDAEAKKQLAVLEEVKTCLEAGKNARILEHDLNQQLAYADLFLLTRKPVIYVANVDEAAVHTGNKFVDLLSASLSEEGGKALVISASIEAQIAELEDMDERAMFLDEYGLAESGLSRLIKASYSLLSLITYFTAGVQEVRAWTIKNGWKAPQAAGVIHTDFEHGFIKVEVLKLDEYQKFGSEQACKEAGKMAIEGKDYVVQDGDIMHFRFNV